MKLQCVIARILRFIHNTVEATLQLRGKIPHIKLRHSNVTIICRHVQESELETDLAILNKYKLLSSHFRCLGPSVDQENFIRVSGRLRNSQLNEDAKHPVLLPKSHHVKSLTIVHYHVNSHNCYSHFTGADDVVRVVEVKTPKVLLRWPL